METPPAIQKVSMATRTRGLVYAALPSFVLAACARLSSEIRLTPAAPPDPAAEALAGYFAALHEGRFADGAALYAGSYEVLQDMNPDVEPDDHPALFERYCTQNGGACLPMGAIVARGVSPDGAALFTIQLVAHDGSIFGQGPCCGEPDTADRRTEFAFTVREADGLFRVVELPPYVP
jgi:hypothetical protein